MSRRGGELARRSARNVSPHRTAFGNVVTSPELCFLSCDSDQLLCKVSLCEIPTSTHLCRSLLVPVLSPLRKQMEQDGPGGGCLVSSGSDCDSRLGPFSVFALVRDVHVQVGCVNKAEASHNKGDLCAHGGAQAGERFVRTCHRFLSLPQKCTKAA